MSFCFLNVGEDDNLNKINIDELFEKKKTRDQKQVAIFNKILNRIHTRINVTGRTKRNDKHIWFNIPEYIFGEPIYDKADCIAYVVAKLEDNGFFIRYMHPNTLFISWENWIPSYVRNEIKKKRGIVIDEKGNILENKNDEKEEPNAKLMNDRNPDTKKEQKQYTPIGSYKPSGHLVYNQEIFDKIEKKVVFT
jgi:hypothetical protein